MRMIPHDVLHHTLAKKVTRKEFLRIMFVGYLSLFGAYGLYKQLSSDAATAVVLAEPENGAASGGATAVAATDASAGKAIKFGSGSNVAYSRPTGAGIYALEDLGVGNDLQRGLDKVRTLAADAKGSRTLTIPKGTYTANGFARSSDYLGFLPPNGVGLVGAGPDTILEVAANTITQSQINTWANSSSNNLLNTLVFPSTTVPVRIAQFTVRGNDQKGYNFNNISFNGLGNGSVAEDLWVYGAKGSLNSPPGETYQVGVNRCNNVVFRRIEADGRRQGSSTRHGALGFGVNNSTNLQFYDCYAHHMGYSHGISLWQSDTIKTWNMRAEYNGTGVADGGGGGMSGDGINHEKSRNCIHYSPRLGYNSLTEIRYYAWPAGTTDSSGTSGNTFGHELHDVIITDGGALNIKIENGQRNTSDEIKLFNCPTPVYQLYNLH